MSTDLGRELLRLALGAGEFSLGIWAVLTALALAAALLLGWQGRSLIDPMAVDLALRPGRAVRWALASLVLLPVSFTLLVLSWVGIPLAVVLALLTPVVMLLGYTACAMVAADRVARAFGHSLTGWQAAGAGVLLFRAVRLLPFVGAPLHSLLFMLGVGATLAAAADVSISWYRRRLPDERQFPDEDIVEWDEP